MKKSKKADLKNTLVEIASNKYDKKKAKEILEGDIKLSMSNVVNSLITNSNQSDQEKRYTSRQYFSEITEKLKGNEKIGYWYSKETYIDQQLELIRIEEIRNSCINGNKTKRMVKDIINEHLHTKNFFNYNNSENNKLFNADESEKQRYEAYDIIKELNIYINKAIKAKKKNRSVNISTKKFKEYYKHTQRNKLNAYLLSEGKRKIFYLANKIPENEQAEYSISKEEYDLFKMNHIIVNKALDLFTDAEIALKSITDEKFDNSQDIFKQLIGKFDENSTYNSEALLVLIFSDDEKFKRLFQRKINYRFGLSDEKLKENFWNYIEGLRVLRNLLFHAKTEIGKISTKNLIKSNGFNILTDFYNDNLVDFLVEKYIGTKISICLMEESLEELIEKSANNMIMSSNYKHLSVNKLFENKIIAAMNWDLKKIKDLDELTEIKHAQKNVIRIIYKNIFLEENNLNELLVQMHNKKSRNKLLNKTNDYMSQVQKEISILENENKFKEAKEIKICMYETYTQVFIEFLNENTKLYNYKNHYAKEYNYDDTKEKIESIIKKNRERIKGIERKYEIWLMLLSLATSVQLSEFKGDLIKYSNLIEKQSGNNSLTDIKELIRIISIVLMVKNSKYQMHETTNLRDIYPQEDIKNLYNKILDSNLEKINQQITESGFENYYLQSDKKTYVYHKSIISILDTLSEFKQYESFFNSALKVNNNLIPVKKLTAEDHKNLNQAKEIYFNNNAKNANKLFEIEKEHIEYNQKMRILSLNYHLDILNIQREIQSRLISLMRNREMDMLFITAALTKREKIKLGKSSHNFIKVLKEKINLLEDALVENIGINSNIKEILFNESPGNNARDKIAHFSLFEKKDGESSIYYLNNKTGLIKEVKNLFRYDIKKEKSIETIIESVFEKYGYFVTFDPETGNLIQKYENEKIPQLKYIKRGENRINLTSNIEQKNIVKVFSEMKVYIK